jgi:hypothetical protein
MARPVNSVGEVPVVLQSIASTFFDCWRSASVLVGTLTEGWSTSRYHNEVVERRATPRKVRRVKTRRKSERDGNASTDPDRPYLITTVCRDLIAWATCSCTRLGAFSSVFPSSRGLHWSCNGSTPRFRSSYPYMCRVIEPVLYARQIRMNYQNIQPHSRF